MRHSMPWREASPKPYVLMGQGLSAHAEGLCLQDGQLKLKFKRFFQNSSPLQEKVAQLIRERSPPMLVAHPPASSST